MNTHYRDVFVVHHLGESATNSIAHFSAPLDFFDTSVKYPPPMNMEVPSSSRCSRGFRQHVVCRRNGLPLQGQFPEHQRYFCLARDAEKCTLELVQLRILGLLAVGCSAAFAYPPPFQCTAEGSVRGTTAWAECLTVCLADH